MERVDSNKIEAFSVVSALDESAGDGDEVGATSDDTPHGLVLTEFYNGTQYLLGKYSDIFSNYTNRISLTLNKLSDLDHQIELKKKSIRKRMRSAVETSEELSDKIRKIADGAKAEVGEEEDEGEEDEEGDDDEEEEGDEEEEKSGDEEGEDEEIDANEENRENETE